MSLNYYKLQDDIAKNLKVFVRKRGYSRLSLSKLTDLPRSTIDHLLTGKNLNQNDYNLYITKINQSFDLPDDYLIRITPPLNDQGLNRNMSHLAVELMNGLDNILDVFSMYIK